MFINLVGPPVFKVPKKIGQWWLINLEGLINPDLTLYIYIGISTPMEWDG